MHLKKLSMIQLDVWASIMWFCMDFFWLWDYKKVSLFFIPFVYVAIFFILKRTKSKNYFTITIITALWFCMNSFWMLSEFFSNPIPLKILASAFGATAFVNLIKLLNKPEIINNFKRLL